MKKALFISVCTTSMLGISAIAYGKLYIDAYASDGSIPQGDCLEMMCEHGCVEEEGTFLGHCCPGDGSCRVDGKNIPECCGEGKTCNSEGKCVNDSEEKICTSKSKPVLCVATKGKNAGKSICCSDSCNFNQTKCCEGKKLEGFISSCIEKQNDVKERCDACTRRYAEEAKKPWITCTYSKTDDKETCVDPWFYKGDPHGIYEQERAWAQHWNKPVRYYADSNADMKLIFNLSKLEPSQFKYIKVIDNDGGTTENITSSGSTLYKEVMLKSGHHYTIDVDFKTYCAKKSYISVECQKISQKKK